MTGMQTFHYTCVSLVTHQGKGWVKKNGQGVQETCHSSGNGVGFKKLVTHPGKGWVQETGR